MRYVVILFLVLIVGSLASALVYVLRDRGSGERAVRALTLRVALSVTLFALLMLSYYFGLFPQKL